MRVVSASPPEPDFEPEPEPPVIATSAAPSPTARAPRTPQPKPARTRPRARAATSPLGSSGARGRPCPRLSGPARPAQARAVRRQPRPGGRPGSGGGRQPTALRWLPWRRGGGHRGARDRIAVKSTAAGPAGCHPGRALVMPDAWAPPLGRWSSPSASLATAACQVTDDDLQDWSRKPPANTGGPPATRPAEPAARTGAMARPTVQATAPRAMAQTIRMAQTARQTVRQTAPMAATRSAMRTSPSQPRGRLRQRRAALRRDPDVDHRRGDPRVRRRGLPQLVLRSRCQRRVFGCRAGLRPDQPADSTLTLTLEALATTSSSSPWSGRSGLRTETTPPRTAGCSRAGDAGRSTSEIQWQGPERHLLAGDRRGEASTEANFRLEAACETRPWTLLLAGWPSSPRTWTTGPRLNRTMPPPQLPTEMAEVARMGPTVATTATTATARRAQMDPTFGWRRHLLQAGGHRISHGRRLLAAWPGSDFLQPTGRDAERQGRHRDRRLLCDPSIDQVLAELLLQQCANDRGTVGWSAPTRCHQPLGARAPILRWSPTALASSRSRTSSTSEGCDNLDLTDWLEQSPVATLDGMHFSVGFRLVCPSCRAVLPGLLCEDHLFTAYIGIPQTGLAQPRPVRLELRRISAVRP